MKMRFLWIAGWAALAVFTGLSSPLWAGYSECKSGCDAERTKCPGSHSPAECEKAFEACVSACISRSITAPDYIAGERPELFGAIAYNLDSGAWAYSVDHQTLQEAEDSALDECSKSKSGCKVYVRMKNQCGAFAASEKKAYGWAASSSKQGAENKALSQCRQYDKSCELQVSACTANV